ncbi:arylsulfatase [Dyadobacter jejuensis]|uniref:Arylsulfatase n=1 Tax=Dyadobacter jejuensis TaxID=1082580 RepID=A0A316ACA4_9BACT|nr:arylsulfatase [Dyadobacter jejuensis]PWJ55049.1 arylsulfatase [Dyadobacter jejuensis]
MNIRALITCFILGLSQVALAQKPNIIVIMADDLGYSDIGCYGSEIKTPNLDALARNGVKFTQFYNAARCCPSRASLLTGVYPHQAGMGKMVVTSDITNRDAETPNQGWLSRNTVTIAEVLKQAGYQTYMSGKWHVGEQRPDWPMQRGFDKYFGLISGANSYYRLLPRRLMLEDNQPYTIPDNFYMTDAISAKAVEYLDEARNNPFFMYVAYTAPHWPLHAPDEEIAPYKGKYMKGWDHLRQERFQKQQKMGLLPVTQKLSDRDATISAWENAPDKEDWDQKMAAYAAMVTRMDKGIGQIVAKLKANGQLENTLIMFLSDNGACSEELVNRAQRDLGDPAYEISLKTPSGAKGSYDAYGKEWANLGNVPFRQYKSFTHEGGISTPLIVHYPKMVKKAFQTDQVGHIMDIMPTCLELAGATYPKEYNDRSIKPVEGKSLLPIIRGTTRKNHDYIAWEHFDSRAVRKDQWKLVWSRENKKWELYDLLKDRSEMKDLSSTHTGKVKELSQIYQNWSDRVGVNGN